ncbi:MAG: YggS family pyridoxal phosphate-dependent enzyme [Saprospiraceae bacterium]
MYTNIAAYCKTHHVKLVAVSKTKPISAIQELYAAGQRIFGENRVQEMTEKYNQLPKDIEWHLIGHLQKNKVKYIAPFVSMIHSIDSFELLEIVDLQAKINHRIIPVLLQFHIATEETKFGLSLTEAVDLMQMNIKDTLSNIKICGVMGMASFTEDLDLIRSEFHTLKNIFDNLKEKYFSDDLSFTEISMGMSGDFKIAIEEGSTMVRVGSAIFGKR